MMIFVSAQVLFPRKTKYAHEKLAAPKIMLLRTIEQHLRSKNAQVATTIDTDCFVHFHDAYDQEVQDWVDETAEGIIGGPNAWDEYLVAITADALVKSQETGEIVPITMKEPPEFYR